MIEATTAGEVVELIRAFDQASSSVPSFYDGPQVLVAERYLAVVPDGSEPDGSEPVDPQVLP